MATVNSVTISGNLTRDPELAYTDAGKARTRLGVAISTRKRVGDSWEDGDPMFFDVTVWDQLAENVKENVFKGDRVTVSGRLQYRSWEADDGTKRNKVEIIGDEVSKSLLWAHKESGAVDAVVAAVTEQFGGKSAELDY